MALNKVLRNVYYLQKTLNKCYRIVKYSAILSIFATSKVIT